MDHLAVLATAPEGLITVSFAADLGVGRDALRELVRRAEIRRVHRGVYVLADRWPSDPVGQHRLMTQAVLLAYPGGVAASHHSAAVLLGLAVYNCDLGIVRLVRTRPGRRTARPGLIIADAVPSGDVIKVGGFLACSAALAGIQIAMTAGVESGVVTLDDALHRGLTTRAAVDRLAERMNHRPGSPALRKALALADGRAESPGESRLRVRLIRLGYPVAPQVRLLAGGKIVARVDLYLQADAVVIEFDGAVKYRTDAGNDGRYELQKEKDRETLLRDHGAEVVRFKWADLDHDELLRRRLDQAITRSRRARGAA